MKIKNFLPVLIIFGIILSGCEAFQTAPQSENSLPTPSEALSTQKVTPTSSIEVDPSRLNGVNITFMYPWTGKIQAVVETLVAEFNSTNEWGIRVTTDAPGSASGVSESVKEHLANFSPPEVIAAPIDFLLTLNQTEMIVADLTPYVQSRQWGLTADEISYYAPVIWNQDVVDNYRYGIPAQRTAKVMVYNKTWADELGFTDLPTTPQIFQQQVCEVTGKLKLDSDASNDGLGGWIVDNDGMTMASWLQTFDAPLETNGQVKFNSKETIEAFEYLRGLTDNNCAWLSAKPSPFDYFSKRQTLIYSADLQELFMQQHSLAIAENPDEWLVLPFPSDSGQFILAQGPSYAILATNEESRLAAWLFVRWMSNVDHQGKIVKASGSLPLGEKSVQYAIELEDSLPQWAQVVNLLPYVKVPPSSADWANARIVLEDASWQLFKTDMKVEQIPDLVKTMDQTMVEIRSSGQ